MLLKKGKMADPVVSRLSTLSGLLKHRADTCPDQVPISSPGGGELTFASLNCLVDAAFSDLLSSGVQRDDAVVIANRDTVELFVMVLAVIQCRAKAVPLHPASTQEEFEFYLAFYEARLLLTGPAGNQTAARAPAARRIPHAVTSIDFSSCHVEISPFVLPIPPGLLRDPAAAVGGDDVVNKPWDPALVLHKPGAMSSGYALTLTQKQLASWAKTGTDPVNVLLRVLDSWLAGVDTLSGNYGLSETLTSVALKGPREASSDTSKPPHGTAVVAASDGTMADQESDLKLKDVLALSAGAMIAVSTTLLNKQIPEAAAEKASVPLLFLYGALVSSLMGQVLQVVLGRFHEFFKALGVLLFYSAAAALALTLLRPGYSHTAFAVTVAAAVASILLVLSRLVPEHGHLLAKWLLNNNSRSAAHVNGTTHAEIKELALPPAKMEV